MSDELFRFAHSARRDAAVDAWFLAPDHEMRRMVQPWFEQIRASGDDVRELIHDRRPTACVEDAAFAYVAAFSAHAAVGFFFATELPDPEGLLEGSGKRMRHVKLPWGAPTNAPALSELIAKAYRDMRRRLGSER